MTTPLIVNAAKVSPLEFFDALTGSSPEKRAERDRLMDEQCIRAIQRGDTYGYPPMMVERCQKLIDEREQLTECVGDPMLKKRRAA